MVIRVAPECLEAFCTASRQLKYTAASTVRRAAWHIGGRERRPGSGRTRRRRSARRPARHRSATAGTARGTARSGCRWSPGRPPPARRATGRPAPVTRVSSVWASRRLTNSAMTSCWAPSWMLRSSRCRSASCRVTRSRRAPRSSSVRRSSAASCCSSSVRRPATRSIRPDCAASPANSRSSTGVSSCPSRTTTVSAPSSSPRSRTARLCRGPSTTHDRSGCPACPVRAWSCDRHRGRPAVADGTRRDGSRSRVRRITRPAGGELEPPAHHQPDLGAGRAGALRQHPGHPGRQLLRRIRTGHRLRETGEHLVRRHPILMQRPGQPPLDAGGGRARRRWRRSPWPAPTAKRWAPRCCPSQRATADHHQDVHQHHESHHRGGGQQPQPAVLPDPVHRQSGRTNGSALAPSKQHPPAAGIGQPRQPPGPAAKATGPGASGRGLASPCEGANPQSVGAGPAPGLDPGSGSPAGSPGGPGSPGLDHRAR